MRLRALTPMLWFLFACSASSIGTSDTGGSTSGSTTTTTTASGTGRGTVGAAATSSSSTSTASTSSTTSTSSVSSTSSSGAATGSGGSSGAASGITRVFSDGFESGNVGLWAMDGTRDLCSVVAQATADAVGPHSGKYQAECNWDGTAAWNDPLNYTTLTQTFDVPSDVLVRMWSRYESDVDVDPSGHFGGKEGRLTTQTFAAGDEIFWGANGGNTVFATVVNNGSPDGADWVTGDYADHQWHKLEFYMHAGLSDDGIFRAWIDGALVVDHARQNVSVAGSVFNTLYLMSNWSGATGCCDHDAQNHVVWDDIEVFSTSAAGTPASGSLSDASAQVP